MERRTVSVPEAARLLGISKNSAYQATRAGTIPAIQIGRRMVVPRSALEKLLGEKLDMAQEGKGAA